MGTEGWVRYPRTELVNLAYSVWSMDSGKTWTRSYRGPFGLDLKPPPLGKKCFNPI